MEQTKTYAEETNDDIIAELKDLLKQQQILINRLEYKLKEKGCKLCLLCGITTK